MSLMNKVLIEQDRGESEAQTVSGVAMAWLANFERALQAGDRASLAGLFADESHWRDLVSFTWTVTQFAGKKDIVDRLLDGHPAGKASKVERARQRAAPGRGSGAGVAVIEAISGFETDTGRGYARVRVLQSDTGKAWSLLASRPELKGHEEPIFERRPTGSG